MAFVAPKAAIYLAAKNLVNKILDYAFAVLGLETTFNTFPKCVIRVNDK